MVVSWASEVELPKSDGFVFLIISSLIILSHFASFFWWNFRLLLNFGLGTGAVPKVTETLTWLKEHFPREAAEPLTTRPTPLGGWSLFGSCMTTSAEEPELEVVPPLEPNEDTEEEPQECSPSSSSTAPEECPLEGDVKVQPLGSSTEA